MPVLLYPSTILDSIQSAIIYIAEKRAINRNFISDFYALKSSMDELTFSNGFVKRIKTKSFIQGYDSDFVNTLFSESSNKLLKYEVKFGEYIYQKDNDNHIHLKDTVLIVKRNNKNISLSNKVQSLYYSLNGKYVVFEEISEKPPDIFFGHYRSLKLLDISRGEMITVLKDYITILRYSVNNNGMVYIIVGNEICRWERSSRQGAEVHK